MDDTYSKRHMCTCVRDGYGRACCCGASLAHVRAIARADDAAVAITCACAGTTAGIYSQRTHVMYYIYAYMYRRKVRVCKCERVSALEYACNRGRLPTMR